VKRFTGESRRLKIPPTKLGNKHKMQSRRKHLHDSSLQQNEKHHELIILQMNSGNLFHKKTIIIQKKGIMISIYNGRLNHKCSWMRMGVILIELRIIIKEIQDRCFTISLGQKQCSV